MLKIHCNSKFYKINCTKSLIKFIMNSSSGIHFSKAFKQFIKPFTCHQHHQQPTFVCIDSNCSHRGMICSICLTINGSHKNHDSIQIHEFVAYCVEASKKDSSKDQMDQLIREIDIAYQVLLKLLTEFHESFSKIIKQYISRKNQHHKQKQEGLLTDKALQDLKSCRFKSIQEMNRTLRMLSGKVLSKVRVDLGNQEKQLVQTQFYLQDLQYETQFIQQQLLSIQQKLKQLLAFKSSTPLVLTLSPTFKLPRFYENQQIIFIGQMKKQKPHGKGISYYKNSGKIVYGNFTNGEMEGKGQLYFSSGDYYLGQFKFDKKEGRGAYFWLGQEENYYEGEFRSGKRHGRGTFWWADGSWYEGQFKDGVQEGFGTLFRGNNFKQYQGRWQKGTFDGQGKQYFQNGQRYEGQFKSDKFDGEGIFYKDDSIVYGIWRDNELTKVNMIKSTLNEKSK